MPYDLISFLLIIFLLVLAIGILVGHFIKGKKLNGPRTTVLFLSLLFVIVIPLFGHSKLNRELQTKQLLASLDQHVNLSYQSDKDAVSRLLAIPGPRKLRVLKEEESSEGYGPDKVYKELVEVNGEVYILTLVCYISPVQWTVFETYRLNQINTEK